MFKTFEELFVTPELEAVTFKDVTIKDFNSFKLLKHRAAYQIMLQHFTLYRQSAGVMPLVLAQDGYQQQGERSEVRIIPHLSGGNEYKLEQVSKGFWLIDKFLDKTMWFDLNKMRIILNGEEILDEEDALAKLELRDIQMSTWVDGFKYSYLKRDIECAQAVGLANEPRIVKRFHQYKLSPFMYDTIPEALQAHEILTGLAENWEGSFKELYETTLGLVGRK